MPDRRLVAGALRTVGVRVDPQTVPQAHYRAVRAIDRQQPDGPEGIDDGYGSKLCSALGVPAAHLGAALSALSELADRRRSGHVLWSEPTPGAIETIVFLQRAGLQVVIVTNSDGHAAENLCVAGILERTGLSAEAVIDSEIVGSRKPDRRIFEAALGVADAEPADVVHVGDMLATDVRGASGMGITAIHLDPYRRCRDREHRHIRSLQGIWAHVAGAAG